MYTYQGHMNTERQGLQSTKPKPQSTTITNKKNNTTDEEQDYFPTPEQPNIKSNQVCYALINPTSTSTEYVDLTGRFPKKSSRGNQYILVGYHYDGNYIHGMPLKDRRGQSITEAWSELNAIFKKAGVAPEMYVLDNETSSELMQAFDDESITYQLVTPYKHRNNHAERAMQTCKNHLKSGLAGTDPNFPLSEWDRLIPQANITLNLLRAARSNPKLSSYAYIHGNFNFQSTPMAPPGTKVLVHMHPDKRGSWELNGQPGWYVGPSPNHYRCVQCFIPRTRTIVHSDSVEFFPNQTPFPAVTMKDHLKQSAEDTVAILTNPPSKTVPSLSAGDEVQNAVLEIAKLLKRADTIPNLPEICTKPLPRVVSQTKYKNSPPESNEPTPNLIPDDDSIVPPPLPTTSSKEPSTSTPNIIPYDDSEYDTQSPRVGVQHSDPVTVQTLLNPSSLPKNSRFKNTMDHSYPLRSRSKLNIILQHMHSNPTEENIAEYMFNPTYSANLICKDDGTKETIDSLLAGPAKATWQRSLSND